MKGSNVTVSHFCKAHIYVIHAYIHTIFGKSWYPPGLLTVSGTYTVSTSSHLLVFPLSFQITAAPSIDPLCCPYFSYADVATWQTCNNAASPSLGRVGSCATCLAYQCIDWTAGSQVCRYTHSYIHILYIHTHSYTDTYSHSYTHSFTYTHIHTLIHIHTHIHTHS
jgi:hypothetical protein